MTIQELLKRCDFKNNALMSIDEFLVNGEFYKQIRTLTIPELEELIIEFYQVLNKYHYYYLLKKDILIRECLSMRKSKLDALFECTPKNIERLCRVDKMIKDRSAVLYKKGNKLYEQMHRIFQKGESKPFSDFNIELSLTVSYNDEHSILRLPDDHSGSNYEKMAEILDDFSVQNSFQKNLICFSCSVSYDCDKKDFALVEKFPLSDIIDSESALWWEGYGRAFPELDKVPIGYQLHHLFSHACGYSLQDIMRINDVWGEVNVVWQHIAGQTWEYTPDSNDFIGKKFDEEQLL
jgi:hypothetical protein